MGATCSRIVHAIMKRGGPTKLGRLCTFIGIQCPREEPSPILLYNCTACGTTLAVEATPGDAADVWVRYTVRGPGRVITDDDTREVEGIRAWLPGALARAGMHLEQVPGIGWRAVSIGHARRTTPTAPMCLRCGGNAAVCDCAAMALIH